MKSKFTKITSFLLASGIMATSVAASANDLDFYHKESNYKQVKYSAKQVGVDDKANRHVSTLPYDFKQEYDGYLYDRSYVLDLHAKHGRDWFNYLDKENGTLLNEEELQVDSVSAITDTTVEVGNVSQLAPVALDEEGNKVDGVKFSYKSSNEDIVKVDEDGLITAVAEGKAEVTIATTNAVKNVEATIEVDVVKELKDMVIKISPEKLVADGETVMEVEVKLNTPNADKMGGMLEIKSNLGLKASKVEEALDKGVAKFKIQLPSSVKELEDVITVTVKSHDVVDGVDANELVGKAISEKVTYAAMGTEGGGSQQVVRKYDVASVRSMDMADRVAVYVGMENKVDLEEVKAAIVDQVKLYNNKEGKNEISLIKVEDDVEVDGGYAFISLIDLGEGEAKDVLHDNQYNYYSVEKKTITTEEGQNNISLKEETPFEKFKDENKFMLIDGKRPEVRVVKSTKNDNKYLPNDSILVEFDEPVNKETAEDPANWVINGKNLKEYDAVRKIELIDVKEAYPEGQAPEWTAITKGKERNSVIISLKPSFARNQLRNGQNNLLQVKSVADWAGMTDKTDNNKISTQEFTFFYDVPKTEQRLEIEDQSPEQFVLELGDILYTDENASDDKKYDMTEDDELKVTLEGKNKLGKDFELELTEGQYEVRNLKDGRYILELTEDWTKILDTEEAKDINAYHGKTFKVAIVSKTYNVYGEQITGEDIEDKEGEVTKLEAEVVLKEDTTSPYIKDYEVLTVGKNKVVDGQIRIEMSEPVQLKKDEDSSHTKPNLTPQVGEEFSEQILEYVMIKDKDGKESKGVRVAGQVVEKSVNEYDTEFTVKPEKPLEAGDWKLVVRAISDDVGNTMKTESEITFTIDGETPEVEQEMLVDPYLVWGYVVDNDSDDVTCDLDKDYVVLLFSREMDIDVLKSSTYNINGKKIDQDAKITDELIEVYKNVNVKDKDELHGKGTKKDVTNVEQWVAHKVVIELPGDFINQEQNKDTNALTLPRDLNAVNDEVDDTKDTLLGGRQYELNFNNYADLVKNNLIPEFVDDATDKISGELIDYKANRDNFINNICPASEDDEADAGEEEQTDAEEAQKLLNGKKVEVEKEKKENKDEVLKAIKALDEVEKNDLIQQLDVNSIEIVKSDDESKLIAIITLGDKVTAEVTISTKDGEPLDLESSKAE